MEMVVATGRRHPGVPGARRRGVSAKETTVAKDLFNISDSAFRSKAGTINALVGAAPGAYGISIEQSEQLNVLFLAFDEAYRLSSAPTTRTSSVVFQKNQTRDFLRAYLRILVRIIRANPAVTEEQQLNLGLSRLDPTATPIDRPPEAPVMQIVSVVGRTVRVKLRAAGTDRRGKADGAAAAEVISYTGAEPPGDPRAWTKAGESTRSIFDVRFPPSTPAGAQVWISSYWKNPRMQAGPPCAPVCIYLGGGVSQRAA
jgi:hypothetical protein